ncbi:MAG TPA: hypothetical protein VHC47_13305 [Mucilaginibacter sp.]|nr:hypothetical protein [Mucilaginibacter sp.]
MKRTLITIFTALACLVFSCSQPSPNADLKRRADSIDIQRKATELARQMVQKTKDSLVRAQRINDSIAPPKQLTAKTVHLSGPCPVTVKECLVVSDRHGKGIIVTLKNTSRKKITAVDVAWVVFNKHKQRLGSSGGKARKLLPAGKTASYAWDIHAENGIYAKASVRAIRYTDGTLWMAD